LDDPDPDPPPMTVSSGSSIGIFIFIIIDAGHAEAFTKVEARQNIAQIKVSRKHFKIVREAAIFRIDVIPFDLI
jgi:hypothetical protein